MVEVSPAVPAVDAGGGAPATRPIRSSAPVARTGGGASHLPACHPVARRGAETLSHHPARFTEANMAESVERFVAALDDDASSPSTSRA